MFSASNRQIGLVSLVEIPYCAETAVSIYWESHRLIITLRPRRGKLVINDLGWKGGRKSAKHLDCALCLPSYAALCLSPWRIDLTQWKRRAFFSRYSCLSSRSQFEIFYSKWKQTKCVSISYCPVFILLQLDCFTLSDFDLNTVNIWFSIHIQELYAK